MRFSLLVILMGQWTLNATVTKKKKKKKSSMHSFHYYLFLVLWLLSSFCKGYLSTSVWMCVSLYLCVCARAGEIQISVGVSHQPKLSSVILSLLNDKLCLCCFVALDKSEQQEHLEVVGTTPPAFMFLLCLFLSCMDAFPPQQAIPKAKKWSTVAL